MSVYIQNTTPEVRRAECARLVARHPNLVPVVLEATGKHAKVSIMALQPTTTIRQLQSIVCEVSNLPKKKLVTLHVAGYSTSSSTLLADLYDNYKSDEGFLYVTYTAEKAMGLSIGGACFNAPTEGDGSGKTPNVKAITAPPGPLTETIGSPDTKGL